MKLLKISSPLQKILSILLLDMFLFIFSFNSHAAVPSKLTITEDMISIMDLSKPAFFTPGDTHWKPAPQILPPGASIAVLEGDPNQAGPFTMRLKLPANYEIPAHWCAMDEHISIINGRLFIGMGDKLDRNKANLFSEGSFARIPLKMHHYAFTTEETIIQLHGIGPWIMGYVDAANDPIKAASGEQLSSHVETTPVRDADLIEELRKTGRLRANQNN